MDTPTVIPAKATLLLLASALLAAPAPAVAQGPERASTTRFAAAELSVPGPLRLAGRSTAPPAVGIPQMTLAGLFTGVVGGLAGAVLVGPIIHGLRCSASGGCVAGDIGLFESMAYGLLIGSAVGPSVGVHASNHRRGSFGHDLLAGGAVAAIAVTVAAADPSSPSPIAISLLGGSLVSAVVERQTSR